MGTAKESHIDLAEHWADQICQYSLEEQNEMILALKNKVMEIRRAEMDKLREQLDELDKSTNGI